MIVRTKNLFERRTSGVRSDLLGVGFVVDEVRRARYAVGAVFSVHGAVTGSFATRVPWIQDHASISPGQLGLALAFPAIGASLSMPLAARISHRFGSRSALRGLIAL